MVFFIVLKKHIVVSIVKFIMEYKQCDNKVYDGMCVRVVVIFTVDLWSNAYINC